MEENNQENVENANESLENMEQTTTKSKGFSIALVTIIVLLIIGGGFGFYFLNSQIDNLERDLDVEKQKVEDQVENEDADTTEEEVVLDNDEDADEEDEEVDEPEPQPTDIDYYNQKYGFGMTFPLTWEDYDATEIQTNWGEFKAQSVSFGFDAQESLFAISVFTKDQWETLQDLPDRRQVTYLDENSMYVFAWSHAQSLENDEMEKRAQEIGDIIDSFYTDAK